MDNCLVILYSPEEIGGDEPKTIIHKYKTGLEALYDFAETHCYWSQLCEETQANGIAKLALELFKNGQLDEDVIINIEKVK